MQSNVKEKKHGLWALDPISAVFSEAAKQRGPFFVARTERPGIVGKMGGKERRGEGGTERVKRERFE